MARKTNKAQVLELAAQLGVEVDYGRMGDDGFEVALYGYAGHMAFDPMGEGHTAITNQSGTGIRTEAGIWGAALRDLRQFEPCAEDCHCRATADADVAVADAEPVTRYYVIANDDTDAEYSGAVIGNCEPVEAMRTMIGIVNNVSRETVTLVETSDGWNWWIQSTLDRGTARFTDPAPNPYRPAPVTLTHSRI